MVVVGPAGNTGRGWSWWRSGREHCGSRVAVEQGRRGRRGGRGGGGGEEAEEEEEKEEEEKEEEKEEEATDIKSKNPHLAGGEQIGKNKHVHYKENIVRIQTLHANKYYT